jgi:hypothetical protein
LRVRHTTIKGRLFFAPPHLLWLIKTELSQRTAMPSPEEKNY